MSVDALSELKMSATTMGAATGPGESRRALSSEVVGNAVQANSCSPLEKLQAVADLVNKLSDGLEKISLLPKGGLNYPDDFDERNDALEELKIYGRDPNYADPIFTKDGMTMLLRYSFQNTPDDTSRAALRVIANAMLLKPETRQIFVDQGYAAQACDRLNTGNWDDEFLLSRVLFLSTYGTSIDLPDLIENHELAYHLVNNLERHVKILSDKQKGKLNPMEDMALEETLKLMFNVTHFSKTHVASFAPAVSHIVALLGKQDISETKPLDAPFGPLINALLNLDLHTDLSQSALYPSNEPHKLTSRLVDLLDQGIRAYSGSDLETVVTPVVSLLAKVYEKAPQPVRQKLRDGLLPTAQDRQGVLGRSDSLSSHLLKNSTNATAPALRDAISHLLFDLSDKDASKFVENVGYGFASGFLFQNNVPVPASATATFNKGDSFGAQKLVNPITGQFLDREKIVDAPDMTDEEKEREAERLFVLFERLKKTGIVNIQNPVEKAVHEGRFEELSDDCVEELD
ncbi:Guanine nucleotide exchange factor, Ric8 [Metarhizium album ARSEF 1941]|uniref:Guanine nucleotide exchange factor, Ric8 n=1 Tax=Metarhizium album (strain ARSEF 1941) TaxID=1081103 RepID=A0A0B2WTB4_METAS|nr:Guanine nucleotide exchange factor, Ric8 [Metarhizium album ARSEF 1941]KHN96894.1 Guanine nucleotide exchange factor, Ric8 [Metarhizium album ARSEF 1941]